MSEQSEITKLARKAKAIASPPPVQVTAQGSRPGPEVRKKKKRRRVPKPRRKGKVRKKHEFKPADASALLLTRVQSSKRLSCSVATIVRLEDAGLLDRIRLLPNGKVHNRADQVTALALQRGESVR